MYATFAFIKLWVHMHSVCLFSPTHAGSPNTVTIIIVIVIVVLLALICSVDAVISYFSYVMWEEGWLYNIDIYHYAYCISLNTHQV